MWENECLPRTMYLLHIVTGFNFVGWKLVNFFMQIFGKVLLDELKGFTVKLLGEIVAKCSEPVGGLGSEVFGRPVGKLLVGELEGVTAKLSGTILTKHFWAGAKACNRSFSEILGNMLAKYFWARGRAWQQHFRQHSGKALPVGGWACQRIFFGQIYGKVLVAQWESLAAKLLDKILVKYFWASGWPWQQSLRAK